MTANITGENDAVNVPKSFYSDSSENRFAGVLEPIAA